MGPTLVVCPADYLGPQVAEQLLGAPGSDPFVRTAQGLTPLHLAAQRGNAAVTALLARTPGGSVDATDLMQRTALHYAAARGHGPVVLELWACGCNIDPVDVTGSTGAVA